MSSNKLDVSLDDLIAATKKKGAPHKGGAKRTPLKTANKQGKQQQQQPAARPKQQIVAVNLKNIRGGVQKGGRGGGRLPFAQQRQQFAGGRGGGRGGGAAPLQNAQPPASGKWDRDMYYATQTSAAPFAAVEPRRESRPNTTKLFISNLHFNVTEDDIRELFQACGQLKEYRVHFDSTGRSVGTAHVIFERAAEAEQALRKYNNVALDGSKMKIELVEAPPPPPGTIQTLNSGIHVQMLPERGSGGGGYGGGFGGGRGGRGPRGRGNSSYGYGNGDAMDMS